MRDPVVRPKADPIRGIPRPEPLEPWDVMARAATLAREGVRGAIATVVARHGSAPSTPGQKLYVNDRGLALGTVGGGAVEKEVLAALVRLVAEPAPAHALRTFRLGAELGMCCGGSVDVHLEPLLCLAPCLIVGAGHVGTAVAPLLAKLGFRVTVADAREDWAGEDRIAGVTTVLGDHDEVGRDLPKESVVLVMTHDHALDQDVIEWALRRGFAFVGGVGSRAKAKRTSDRLRAKGFSEEDRARVRMPVGLPIGARLPDEIAVAIAAELIAWRRGSMSVDSGTSMSVDSAAGSAADETPRS